VKTLKGKPAETIEEILQGFFNKEIVSKLLDEIPAKKRRSSKYSDVSKSYKNVTKKEIINSFKTDNRIDSIITRSESALSKDKFLKLLLKLGEFFITKGELTSAVYIYEKIIGITKRENEFSNMTAGSYLSLGTIFSRQALWGISFNYINEAYNIFKKVKDRKGCANCENLLGSIQGELGNRYKAQEHFENAMTQLVPKRHQPHR
jgi:tetratricopeptide (TPR) repeat protein